MYNFRLQKFEKFKYLIDDIFIDLRSFLNCVSMKNIIRTLNPMVRFLKFTFKK